MENLRMFIDGEWVSGNRTLPVVNPTTGKTMANVPAANADDIDRAVKAARKAFDEGPWRSTTALDRGKVLFKIADAIRQNADDLAKTDTMNMGKPIVEAEFDVNDAANCFEYYGGLATKIHGQTLSVPDNAMSMV